MNAAASGSDGLPPLRDVIARYELAAKKSLGQNFLLDLNLTRKIARAAGDLSKQTVVEIGPGPGGLTRALLMEGAKRIIAVERDERCLPALDEISAHYPGCLTVEAGDALKVDWTRLTDGAHPVTIAANLPYNIASVLLVTWLETEPWPPWFDRMVLMFQREVAERITAQPHTKAYGRLSVLAQWRTRPHIVINLPPEAFTPPPKVASAVVDFRPMPTPEPACRAATLSRVTAAAFGQRRKMLRSSLKQLMPLPELLLREAGIAPERRAEDLSVTEFATLAAILDRAPHNRG
ncbi:16S rRNA (adenine(1518)-N(6)/adenine(1519)-N(6))-dimethyltransferase RsmA [Hyphomicrobium sp.]|jgi:16S rRNA (adenine1518-N6/adenine1519-N6)-dimethyltransferase|uniref:16S rRNA (adenine(1518)-N(6)/adenine(1519)-N(6))- dimethyltransferase RsmA n=1 Tax=Hyphomicrobium sp. TaxID=82 RepID=UPI002B7C8D2E|nr:16S rRNA (adenine(1518)-N(6)/adenine(1519)-N(6))-dimethyltransferase RsmA [Hyphomicrobium sp.]HVZ05282.1 16S rRNA (adenine(1518)-N(6)/adenine(1519)-N(6))-dimethyltransferase RsmA [Hyphomicrobium sp.]